MRTRWPRSRRHAASGDDVVLVSASFAVYLRPVAEHLGLATGRVVATELGVDGDGRCSGVLDGGNCRGDAKVERLHAWLDAHHGGRAAVELWAYGDSAGDARDARRRRPRGVGDVIVDEVAGAAAVVPAAGRRRPAACSAPPGHCSGARTCSCSPLPARRACSTTGRSSGRRSSRSSPSAWRRAGIYLWNDALDVEADRLHPMKRTRPVAAGVVPVRTAEVVGTLLPSSPRASWPPPPGGGRRWASSPPTSSSTMAYSAVAEAHRRDRPRSPSPRGSCCAPPAAPWPSTSRCRTGSCSCTVFGSLFIVTGKRYAEMREHRRRRRRRAQRRSPPTRLGYLRIVLAIVVRGGADELLPVGVRDQGAQRQHAGRSTSCRSCRCSPPCCATSSCSSRAGGAAPEEVFASDRVLQVLGVAWVVAVRPRRCTCDDDVEHDPGLAVTTSTDG